MNEKQKLVKEIQKLAERLFNEEIMKLHYKKWNEIRITNIL
jgi:lipopolysaccharide biosynthesis glycosyltransferase